MKFRRMDCKASRANTRQAGFTLAEVLAALVFMAIVIPAAVHGLRLAGMAGEVAQRKTVAVRCDRLPEGAHGKEGVDGRVRQRALKDLQIGISCCLC